METSVNTWIKRFYPADAEGDVRSIMKNWRTASGKTNDFRAEIVLWALQRLFLRDLATLRLRVDKGRRLSALAAPNQNASAQKQNGQCSGLGNRGNFKVTDYRSRRTWR